jgi:hypothetical protein
MENGVINKMTRWNYYYSGILYSTFEEEAAGLFIQQLDFTTGELKEKIPFTEEENQLYRTLCKRDILQFFKKKDAV